MATTWAKRKRGRIVHSNPQIASDALAARRVLRDCYRAKDRFERAASPVDRRLSWVLAVTLLRTVGHVLKNVDGKRSRFLTAAIRQIFEAWKKDGYHHAIYHDFIEKQRNAVLKEYRIDPSTMTAKALGSQFPDLILIGVAAYSPTSAISAALAWWETQLDLVEAKAADLRCAAK